MSLKTPFADAMRAQPDNLAAARSTVLRSLDDAVLAPWEPGETIGVVAMGASSHSGHALVAMLAGLGVRAVNLVASDLTLAKPGFQPADHYVLRPEPGADPRGSGPDRRPPHRDHQLPRGRDVRGRGRRPRSRRLRRLARLHLGLHRDASRLRPAAGPPGGPA